MTGVTGPEIFEGDLRKESPEKELLRMERQRKEAAAMEPSVMLAATKAQGAAEELWQQLIKYGHTVLPVDHHARGGPHILPLTDQVRQFLQAMIQAQGEWRIKHLAIGALDGKPSPLLAEAQFAEGLRKMAETPVKENPNHGTLPGPLRCATPECDRIVTQVPSAVPYRFCDECHKAVAEDIETPSG